MTGMRFYNIEQFTSNIKERLTRNKISIVVGEKLV